MCSWDQSDHLALFMSIDIDSPWFWPHFPKVKGKTKKVVKFLDTTKVVNFSAFPPKLRISENCIKSVYLCIYFYMNIYWGGGIKMQHFWNCVPWNAYGCSEQIRFSPPWWHGMPVYWIEDLCSRSLWSIAYFGVIFWIRIPCMERCFLLIRYEWNM